MSGWRRSLFWTAVLSGLLVPSFLYDLRLPDEPRVAHTGLEMARTGDIVLPTVNGAPFLQTPPLHYWMLAACFASAGFLTDGLARVPSVLFTFGSLWLTVLLARRLGGVPPISHQGPSVDVAAGTTLSHPGPGSASSFVAAAILASTFGFWDAGHRVVVDTALTFFLTLAFYRLAIALVEGNLRASHGLCIGAAAGGAFLVKGWLGPVILAPVVVYGLLRIGKQRRRGLPAFVASALLAFLLIAAPWVVALYLRNPAYVEELLFSHIGRRVFAGAHHNPTNFTFVHRSLLKLLPWSVFLPFVLVHHIRLVWGRASWRRAGAWRASEFSFNEFLLIWFLFPVLLLLLSRSKRELYLLPVFPAAALMTSLWLERSVSRVVSRRVVIKFLWVLLVVVPVGGTLVRALGSRGYSVRSVGETLASLEREGSVVVGHGLWEREASAVAWYLRHPFENISDPQAFSDRLRDAGQNVTVVGDRDDLQLLVALPDESGLEGARLLLEEPARRRTLQVWVVK